LIFCPLELKSEMSINEEDSNLNAMWLTGLNGFGKLL